MTKIHVYYDDLQEAEWFKGLTRCLNNATLIQLEGRGRNPRSVERLLSYDKPNIIVFINNQPKLVLEKTSEVPTGHNLGQRFARFANAMEEKVMVVFFLPFAAKKHGEYAAACWMPARFFIALGKMEEIHKVPAIAVDWPCNQEYELILDGSRDGEESIKVGAVYPLTGSLALAGENARNGILFAVDIINNEYDLDLPFARSKGISSLNNARLEIVFSDSQENPEIGKSAAESLITDEEVVATIGCYQSAVTDEVSQLIEAKGVPFLTATSTAPSLTQKGLKWFFRTTPDEDVFIKNFYEFINDIREANNTRAMRLGVVYEDSVWGTECAEYAGQYAGVYGYQLTEEISYSSDTEDISGEVQRLTDSQVNVIIQASYTKDAILFMQTYKEMGFSPDAILADDAGFTDPEFLRTLGSDATTYSYAECGRRIYPKSTRSLAP